MRDNLNKVIIAGLFVFVLYMIVSTVWISPNIKKSKLESKQLVTGLFEEIGDFSVGRNTSTKYSYTIDNKKYLGEIGGKVPCKNLDRKRSLEGHEIWDLRFPVAVSNEDHSYSVPLLRPEDFTELNMTFPDSLSIVFEKYFHCDFNETHFY